MTGRSFSFRGARLGVVAAAPLLAASSLLATRPLPAVALVTPASASAQPDNAPVRVVTTLTGDHAVVSVDAAGVPRVSLRAAPGRERVPVFQTSGRGYAYLVPADLVGKAGRGIDMRRFDVGALALAGFDDARTAPLAALPDRAARAPKPVPGRSGHNVDITVIDQDGKPATNDEASTVFATEVDHGTSSVTLATLDHGVAHFTALAGEYDFNAWVASKTRRPRTAMVTSYAFAVRGDSKVTLDARSTTTARISLPNRAAKVTSVVASHCHGYDSLNGCWSEFSASGADLDDLAFSPTTRPLNPPGGFTFSLQALASAPGKGAPDVYHVVEHAKGHVPAHPAWRLRPDDFATVRTTYYAQQPGTSGVVETYDLPVGSTPNGLTVNEDVGALPASGVEHYQADRAWRRAFHQERAGAYALADSSDVVAYQRGAKGDERWNNAVRGIGVQPVNDFSVRVEPDQPAVQRRDNADGQDMVLATPQLYSDPERRRSGLPPIRRRHFALFANGKPARGHRGGTSWSVAPGPADYRLTATLDNANADTTLSSHVAAEWTFRSGHGSPGPLPVDAITLAPGVNTRNQAPADRGVPIALDVYRQPGARTAPARALTLSVSYDDGKTWIDVPVTRHGQRGEATAPRPPAGARFASIRTSARAADGSTVAEEILHAYLIGAS